MSHRRAPWRRHRLQCVTAPTRHSLCGDKLGCADARASAAPAAIRHTGASNLAARPLHLRRASRCLQARCGKDAAPAPAAKIRRAMTRTQQAAGRGDGRRVATWCLENKEGGQRRTKGAAEPAVPSPRARRATRTRRRARVEVLPGWWPCACTHPHRCAPPRAPSRSSPTRASIVHHSDASAQSWPLLRKWLHN